MRAPRTVAFKRLAEPVLGKMLQPSKASEDDVQVPFLKAGHVTWGGLELPPDLPQMWARRTELEQLGPKPGDLLICEGGEVGRAALVREPLPESTIIQNSLHLVKAKPGVNTSYLKYALEHVALSGWLDIVCNKATIAHLTVDKLRELQVPLHEEAAQQRIARFLDEQTTKIDTLIDEKQRLLATLDHALEAFAFHYVTEGVGGRSVPTGRPEGWLSKVPAHWATPKLGYFADVGNGCTPRREVDKYWRDGTIPWVTSTAINDTVIEQTAERVTDVALAETGLRMVRPGSAIVGLIGQGPTRGMTAKLAIPATVSQNVAFVTSRSTAVSDDYLIVVLTGLYSALRFLSDGSGGAQGAMNCDTLRAFRVPIAPANEQPAIVDAFAAKRAAIEGLQRHVSLHAERLREYRAALISGAVTGQLDVSNTKSWREERLAA